MPTTAAHESPVKQGTGGPSGRKNQARLAVNMGRDTAAALADLMDKRDTTATDIVRRAISLMAFVEKSRDEGNRLALISESGGESTVREIILGVD